MLELVAQTLKESVFVRFPGYIWAPVMLIGGSLFLQLRLILKRRRQPATAWETLDQTFAFSRWKTRSVIPDVVLYLARMVLPALASNALAFALAGSFALLLGGLGAAPQGAELGAPGIFATAVLLVVLLDLGDYFAHLALHRIPMLWELHKVHHSATFLSPVTSFRVHPFEAIVYTVCHSVTIAPLLGAMAFFYRLDVADLVDLMFTTNLAILVLTFNHLKHSHLPISLGPLDYVLISPHMHQLHHSSRLEHWDKNLGLVFSAWDWIFGTAVREDTDVPVSYGIGRGPEVDAQYQTLTGMFVRPVINMALLAAGRISAETRLEPDRLAAKEPT
jgi:sterol desaturase/sphingolipid hydroxylase (fatty acid hydroxylase superfamily)